MIVTFCGHSSFLRDQKHEEKILNILADRVGEVNADFYLGGYGNFDNFAYECCKKYQKSHPKVSIIFITPYITLEYQKNHLKEQEKMFDAIIYPEIEKIPKRFAIVYRNRWMIDQADLIIAGVNHSFGGAYKAFLYAKAKKKEIINLFEGDV